MARIEPATLRWLASIRGDRVVRSEALRGGLSSRMHRCWFEGGESVVVRHIDDADWLRRDPDLISREVAVLQIAGSTGLPVPSWIGDDPAGGRLAMTWLPGRMIVHPDELSGVVEQIADVAADIAAVTLPVGHGLPAWSAWVPERPRPPAWGDPLLWERAIRAYERARPTSATPGVLLHRDLHPLNLLWEGDVISGVVDWTFACVGHRHAELGHCRWNLAVLADRDAADGFLDRYLAITDSAPYSPVWDLAALLGLPDDEIGHGAIRAAGRTDLDHDAIVRATEDLLADALMRLGG